ncbi:unnamed protein product [Caenorhabditis brenneri]
MGGSNSKSSIFDEHPKEYLDVCKGTRVYIEKGWFIRVRASRESICFGVRMTFLAFPADKTYEFVYQIILINKHNLKRKLVIRGVKKLKENELFSCKKFYNAHCVPTYNQFNVQAVLNAVIDKNGLRKLSFGEKNVYGKSKTVSTLGGCLEVPVQFIKMRAPLLAKHVKNQRLYHRAEEFFQVFYGVHVQLEEKEIRSLLDISAKFEVLNVKRYCEQQLIWREDLKISEKKKFKMACKYNLSILMNQLLSKVKTKKKLLKLVSIAIETESMNANISKLLIAKLYQVS